MDRILEAMERARRRDGGGGEPEASPASAGQGDARPSAGDALLAANAAARNAAIEPINPRAIRSLDDIPRRAPVAQAAAPVVEPEPVRAAEPALSARPEPARESPPAAAPVTEAAPAPASAPVAAQASPIVYTRTRQHRVSQEFFRAHRVISAYPKTAAAEAYGVLAAQLLQLFRQNDWNVLAVVSPNFGEGKTLTAVNLAITLARAVGHTALLVDADLRDPTVHTFFDLPPRPGLSDHLIEGIALEDTLVNPGIDKLVVLPGGRALRSASEVLGSSRMRELVGEIKRRYPTRVIVFDLPPVLFSADALAFLPHVDATLMVVEEGKTGSEEAARAAELLHGANLIGTVVNKSQFAKVGTTPLEADVAASDSRVEPRLHRMPAEDTPGSGRDASPPAGAGWWGRILSWFTR